MCYTFDTAKCDRIFAYLLQEKQIKLPCGHVIPSLEWHNSYSHATNDCNVLYRQVQLAINEGRLKFVESLQMKLDKDPFPTNMNMVELNGKKVLVWPSQAESMLAVIKCIYLPQTYLHFIQDIEDRCLLLMSSMSFVDLPLQEHQTTEKHHMD
jgi:hypothetical protein